MSSLFLQYISRKINEFFVGNLANFRLFMRYNKARKVNINAIIMCVKLLYDKSLRIRSIFNGKPYFCGIKLKNPRCASTSVNMKVVQHDKYDLSCYRLNSTNPSVIQETYCGSEKVF